MPISIMYEHSAKNPSALMGQGSRDLEKKSYLNPLQTLIKYCGVKNVSFYLHSILKDNDCQSCMISL